MSRFALVAVALLAPALAHAADPVPRVAVICIGDDPATTGVCQRELEARFVAPKFALRDAQELAQSIASRAVPQDRSDPAEKKRAAEMLEAGAKAYYDDKLVDALDKLAAVQALHERAAGISTEERIRLLLWRTAVFLALGDRPKAEGEARAALILSPALEVDLSVFRPSVKSLVDELRAAGLPSATVILSGAPPSAEVKIDGRPATERVQVPLGRHRLVARAPGFLEVDRSIDVTGDASIPLAMPLSLDPQLEKTLAAVVEKGDVTPETKRVLEKVAERARVDAVVVTSLSVRVSPAVSRSFVYWRSGLAPSSAGSSGGGSVAAIADIAFARVDATASTAIASLRKGPSPIATPASTPRADRPSTPIALAARGDVAFVQRERTVEGRNGIGYDSGFIGVGPRVSVDLSRGPIVAVVQGSYVSYSMSTLEVNTPAGGSRTVTGGSTIGARIAGGWSHSVTTSLAVAGLAGVAWEKHDAEDVRDGGALGIFPSEQRTAIELRAQLRARVTDSAIVVAGVGVSPLSRWTETPSGTTGASPKSALAPIWQLGASAPFGSWEAGLSYDGELRSTRLSGRAAPPVDPPVEDATVRHTLHTVAITISRGF